MIREVHGGDGKPPEEKQQYEPATPRPMVDAGEMTFRRVKPVPTRRGIKDKSI